MSKYFLTGEKGFVGTHLKNKMCQLGHEVISDMRYLHTQKYNAVIHLSSKNNINNEFDAELIESNFILAKEIFKVPTRIIYASSCVAEFPLNPYAYSKLYAEHLGSIHGNAIGLRFHNIYGPGNNKGIVKYLCEQPDGAEITLRGPSVIRDYIYVDDVVNEIVKHFPWLHTDYTKKRQRGHINSIKNEGVVDVGTGVGTSTIDLVKLYMKLSGKKFVIDGVPHDKSEPAEMVSNNIVPHISLEEGLLKMVNND